MANVDTKGLALSKHVHLRVIPERFTVLHLHDRAERYAQEKVAELTKSRSQIGPLLEKYYDAVCKMKAKDDLEEMDEVHPSFRSPYCHKQGASGCVCEGPGVTQDIWII